MTDDRRLTEEDLDRIARRATLARDEEALALVAEVRRLRGERDEAQAEAQRLRESAATHDGLAVAFMDRAEKAERERDEARVEVRRLVGALRDRGLSWCEIVSIATDRTTEKESGVTKPLTDEELGLYEKYTAARPLDALARALATIRADRDRIAGLERERDEARDLVSEEVKRLVDDSNARGVKVLRHERDEARRERDEAKKELTRVLSKTRESRQHLEEALKRAEQAREALRVGVLKMTEIPAEVYQVLFGDAEDEGSTS